MSKKSFIDSVEVKTPCSESWDEMSGNDQVRFCSHCAKRVNNISEMTRKDAIRLVRVSGGRLCIRYRQDPLTRRPLFADGLIQIARRTPGLTAGALTAAVALSTPAYAQTEAPVAAVVQADTSPKVDGATGKISGTVTDPAGAVLAYLLVSLTNEQTSEYRTSTTSAEGLYEFRDLPAGTYTLKVEAGGFETNSMTGITLADDSILRRDTQMELAKVNVAVEVGNTEKIEQYVTVGLIMGDVSVSEVRTNPLMIAIRDEDVDRVKDIVARKPKVNFKDRSNDGITPLHAAVETGDIEIVQFLLDAGAKIGTKDSLKRTAIMMMDEDATPELLDLLIRYGAATDLRDKRGNTLLHLLIQNSAKASLIGRLSGTGINFNSVNKDGKTALMLAAEADDQDMVEALLGGGANATLTDKEGKSAADRTANDAVAQMLIAHGGMPRNR